MLTLLRMGEPGVGHQARPMAAPTEARAQNERERGAERRRRVVREIVDTEKSYRDSLVKGLSVYEPILQKVFGPGDRTLGNMQSLLKLSTELLRELSSYGGGGFEETTEEENIPCGKIFLKLGPFLRLFAEYALDFSARSKTLAERRMKNKDFDRVLTEARQSAPTLESILISPVQRVPRYVLLFHELVKLGGNAAEGAEEETRECVEAHELLEKIANQINETIRHRESGEKLLEIQKHLVQMSSPLATTTIPNGTTDVGTALPLRHRIAKVVRRATTGSSSSSSSSSATGSSSSATTPSRVAPHPDVAPTSASPQPHAKPTNEILFGERIFLKEGEVVVEGEGTCKLYLFDDCLIRVGGADARRRSPFLKMGLSEIREIATEGKVLLIRYHHRVGDVSDESHQGGEQTLAMTMSCAEETVASGWREAIEKARADRMKILAAEEERRRREREKARGAHGRGEQCSRARRIVAYLRSRSASVSSFKVPRSTWMLAMFSTLIVILLLFIAAHFLATASSSPSSFTHYFHYFIDPERESSVEWEISLDKIRREFAKL